MDASEQMSGERCLCTYLRIHGTVCKIWWIRVFTGRVDIFRGYAVISEPQIKLEEIHRTELLVLLLLPAKVGWGPVPILRDSLSRIPAFLFPPQRALVLAPLGPPWLEGGAVVAVRARELTARAGPGP